MGWFEDIGGAGEVVYNSNTEDLKDHLVLDVSSDLIVFNRFLKLGDGVVIFVCELPPF